MKRLAVVGAGCLVISLAVGVHPDAGAQRRYYDSPRGIYTQQLVRRIDELERRVERLERLLPDNARDTKSISVETAEQRLVAAQDRFDYAEELFRKAYISQAQLEAEKFELKRAEKVLACARASRAGEPTADLVLEIEILEAERDLAVAKRQLAVTERLAQRGYIDRAETEAHRLAVEAAERRLDKARQPRAEEQGAASNPQKTENGER